jgi:WD40 repeat protein
MGESSIVQLAFNHAGTRLAWRDSLGRIGVRNVGRAGGDELPIGRGMCHVTFASEDRVAGVSCEGRVLAWDLAEMRSSLLGRHELGHCGPDCGSSTPGIWSASVEPGGAVVATAGREGTVGLWPIGHDPVELPRLPIGRGRRSFHIGFAGDLLIVANRDPVAQLWNWRTRRHVADLPGHETWAYALAVAHPAAGETAIVTGSRSGVLRFWRPDGSLLRSIHTGHMGRLSCANDLATSPSGRLVAVALASGEVEIHDAGTGAAIAYLKAHEGWARRVTFLDEATVLSAGDDGVVQRIALPSGAVAASIRAHTGPIYDMDRHGDSLLTASRDGTVRLIDLRDGSLARTYVGHQQPVIAVRWHAGGERFVSGDGDAMNGGSREGRACVWRIDRETCQDWLIGHRDDVRAAQFIGERVVTASFDGTVRIWTPLPPATAEQLAAELERRGPACLDEQQRMTYLGEPSARASERAQACRRAP